MIIYLFIFILILIIYGCFSQKRVLENLTTQTTIITNEENVASGAASGTGSEGISGTQSDALSEATMNSQTTSSSSTNDINSMVTSLSLKVDNLSTSVDNIASEYSNIQKHITTNEERIDYLYAEYSSGTSALTAEMSGFS